MKPADLILKSTRIFTAEAGEDATMSGSIAIADGRIAFVGSDEEAAAEGARAQHPEKDRPRHAPRPHPRLLERMNPPTTV